MTASTFWRVLLLSLGIFIASQRTFAIDSTGLDGAREIIDAIHDNDFDLADDITRVYSDRYPEKLPMLDFLRAYELFWRELILGERLTGGANGYRFADAAEESIRIIDSAAGNADSESILLKACAYMLLGLYDLVDSRLLAGVLKLRRASQLAESIREDTTIVYDAKVVYGMYRYYGIIRDQRYMEDLDEAMAKGRLFSDLAEFFKGRILLEEEKAYARAADIFLDLTAKSPGNPLFHFYLAECRKNSGQLDEAFAAYLAVLDAASPQNGVSEAEIRARYSMGQIYKVDRQDYGQAIDSFLAVLSLIGDKDYVPILSGIPPLKHKEYLSLFGRSLMEIGDCYARMREYDKAKEFLNRVSPDYDRAAYKKAQEILSYLRATLRARQPDDTTGPGR